MKNHKNTIITIHSLFKAVFVILIFTMLSGCNALMTKVYVVENFNQPISPEKSYVILGQEIGEGNLERVSYALHINGKPLAKSKGIQLPDAADVGLIAPNQIDFLLTDNSRKAYRIWEIEDEDINPDSRAMLFLQAITNEKAFWMKKRHKLVGLLSTWMAPMEYGGEKKANKFLAIPFELTKPGVYYLGEAFISGTLKASKEGLKTRTKLNTKRKITHSPELAKAYLNKLGINTASFFDLSSDWKNLAMTSLDDYKIGDPALYYAIP